MSLAFSIGVERNPMEMRHQGLRYVCPLAMALVDYVLHYARCPTAPSGAMEHIMHLVVSIMAPEMSSFGCLLLGSWLDPWI